MNNLKQEGFAFIQDSIELEKNNITITAPVGPIYSSQFTDRLSPNTFINKGTAGIGAATMALVSDEKFIITESYKGLLTNNIEWRNKFNTDALSIQTADVSLNRGLFQSNFPILYQSQSIDNIPISGGTLQSNNSIGYQSLPKDTSHLNEGTIESNYAPVQKLTNKKDKTATTNPDTTSKKFFKRAFETTKYELYNKLFDLESKEFQNYLKYSNLKKGEKRVLEYLVDNDGVKNSGILPIIKEEGNIMGKKCTYFTPMSRDTVKNTRRRIKGMPKESQQELAELAISIQDHGIKKPVHSIITFDIDYDKPLGEINTIGTKNFSMEELVLGLASINFTLKDLAA